MEIPALNKKDHQNLENLACLAKEEADNTYERGADGYFSFKQFPLEYFEGWDTLQEAVDSAQRTNRHIYDMISRAKNSYAEITEKLLEKGMHGFYLIGEGTHALAFAMHNGNDQNIYALRIAVSREKKNTVVRSSAPHILQGYFNTRVNPILDSDLMPYVKMFNPFDAQTDSFKKLINKLYEGTCFDVDRSIDTDHAILANGTIVFVDPDLIRYTEEFYRLSQEEQQIEVARSIALIMHRAKEWGLDDVFIPMSPDASHYKQELLFKPPTQTLLVAEIGNQPA